MQSLRSNRTVHRYGDKQFRGFFHPSDELRSVGYRVRVVRMAVGVCWVFHLEIQPGRIDRDVLSESKLKI